MKNKAFRVYSVISFLCILLVSYYPLNMGIRVISDMLTDGTVMKENYPKYIIPYTPVAVAVLGGVLFMPLLIKLSERLALLIGSGLSVGAFFTLELLFEQKVVVTTEETVAKLEDWQMFMCYIPPEPIVTYETTHKTHTPIEILIGEYDPAFKLHFYIISVVLILSILNSVYGFAKMTLSPDRKRLPSLVLQTASSVLFLGLCILACFTAFWRDGTLEISPLSASLMTVFFIIFGNVGGLYVGSFLTDKRGTALFSAVTSSLLTLLMYVGEMILLHGNLYIYGKGFLFSPLPVIILSPFDILVIISSGALTASVFTLMKSDRKNSLPKIS